MTINPLFLVNLFKKCCYRSRLVLLYDDLVGVVTSHVTKMAVTPLDPPWPKPPVVPQFNAPAEGDPMRIFG